MSGWEEGGEGGDAGKQKEDGAHCYPSQMRRRKDEECEEFFYFNFAVNRCNQPGMS